MAYLLHRLKEREFVQWVLAYLAGAWAMAEPTSLAGAQFHWPEVVGQVATLGAFFGVFITLILALFYREKGRQRVSRPELLMAAATISPERYGTELAINRSRRFTPTLPATWTGG